MEKWKQALESYKIHSQRQIGIFTSLGDECPYLFFEDIDFQQISSEEKQELGKLDIASEASILGGVNQILGHFKKIGERKVSEEEAERKLCSIERYIPEEKTIDFHSFSITCSMYTDVPFKTKELAWLWRNGYIPHLYYLNNEPRFHSNMWFITDFVVREVRKKTSLGIVSGFKDFKNLPKFWRVRSWLALVHYMYYSWLIVESVLEYSDKLVRSKGLKGINFRIARENIADKLYKNEAKVLANKLIKMQDILTPQVIKWYRDTFAIYSFEAFPLNYLIHAIDTEGWRGWFLTEGHRQGLLSTYHYPVEVNTYPQDSKSTAYHLLSVFTEGALAIHEGRKILGTEDIIEQFHREGREKGKRPCKICGEHFKPKRKFEVTCGKSDCIKENKNRSKRASLIDKLRYF